MKATGQKFVEKVVMPIYDRLMASAVLWRPGRSGHLIAQTLKGRTYVSDGIVSSHYSAKWIDELEFYESSWSLVNSDYKDSHFRLMRHRAYLTTHLVNFALRVEGDVVELGVHWGILPLHYSQCLQDKIQSRSVWFFDLWGQQEEFSKRSDLPTGGGSYEEDNFEKVKQRFRNHRNCQFVRGYVPDTLQILEGRQIAYLSLDLNSSEPEEKALRQLWGSISSGGVVFFDDIGGITYSEQREKIESFLIEVGQDLMYLPSGQAYLIKH